MQRRWGNKEGARGERKHNVKVRGGGRQETRASWGLFEEERRREEKASVRYVV